MGPPSSKPFITSPLFCLDFRSCSYQAEYHGWQNKIKSLLYVQFAIPFHLPVPLAVCLPPLPSILAHSPCPVSRQHLLRVWEFVLSKVTLPFESQANGTSFDPRPLMALEIVNYQAYFLSPDPVHQIWEQQAGCADRQCQAGCRWLQDQVSWGGTGRGRSQVPTPTSLLWCSWHQRYNWPRSQTNSRRKQRALCPRSWKNTPLPLNFVCS